MINCRVWLVKVEETVSDKALEDQGEFDRSIDKVQHTEKSD